MRIAITGTSNVGKSTLLKDFLQEWDMYTTPNKTYREFLQEQNLPHSSKTTKDTQWRVLNFLVDSMQQYQKGDKVVYDRCPLDNMVYTLWAYERCINDIDQKFVNKCIPIVRESLRMLDVIFYIPLTAAAPIEIVDDNLRDTDKTYITEIDNIFKGLEQQYFQGVRNSPFFPSEDCPAIVEVFGTREQRLHLIKQYIDAEGDVIGEDGGSSILGEEALAMEQILQDQQQLMNKEKAHYNELMRQIQMTKRN